MKILIAYETRHGASAEAAAAIARGMGQEAEVKRISEVDCTLVGYDLVVVGGPIYFGKFAPEVPAFLAAHESELSNAKIAAFVLGMMPNDYRALLRSLVPVSLRSRLLGIGQFDGKIDNDKLGFAERVITKAVGKMLEKQGGTAKSSFTQGAESFGAQLAAEIAR